ncbi:cupin domain-containing protein [Larkinella sp. GY13]|uniref:cupin domain-containing protein n=1 Tax=Larkinella sp. GY13 TaxID=3453720 RepID=UPI003EECDB80
MKELNKTDSDRILDFPAAGMWWQITKDTKDTNGAFFEVINVLVPGFEGPPQHIHPQAEESYQVLEGTLDVWIDGQWRLVKPGETATVPAGVPHTLKNSHPEPVRLLNIHKPALGFERFFRRMHTLITSGKMTLPPKNFGSLIRISMLFVDHEKEIKSANPPHGLMRFLAFVGSTLGYKLPD